MNKKKIAWLLVLTMLLTVGISACKKTETPPESPSNEATKMEETAETGLKDGVYTGEATGYGGTVKSEVTVKDGKIANAKVVEHGETTMISDMAISEIPKRVVETQSLAVDGVSGCTVSSMAVKKSLEKALESAGADLKALKKEIVKEAVERKTEEKEADVVIIGAGGAGLSAAVSAYEHGAKSVIIVEKMPFIGGNTLRAGGAYNAADPEVQKAQGIEDSIEKHIEQTYEGGHKVGNLDLVTVMCTNALDGVHWLADMGLEWKEKIGSVVGSKWPRSHQTEKPLGTGYITVLGNKVKELGGEILLNTKASELIVEDGKVVGVKAEGIDTDYTIRGNKGVIMATGGYAGNPEMVREYLSDGVYTKENLPEKLVSTNHPGATGEGILMAQKIGADVIDMQHIQLLPMPGDRFGPSINVEDSFFINKEGKRYVKEDGGRDEICLATLAQTDGQYFMITNAQIVPENRKTLSGENLDVLIAKGIVVEADSVEDLAEKIGVPADALKETIDTFNGYVEKQEDPEFGRTVWGKKIEKAPFYATLRYPALHHTMGGLHINTEAQVLNKDGKVIPGLFAAGEVTGGIHGDNRLGGNAIADIIVFGRIAGESIMK